MRNAECGVWNAECECGMPSAETRNGVVVNRCGMLGEKPGACDPWPGLMHLRRNETVRASVSVASLRGSSIFVSLIIIIRHRPQRTEETILLVVDAGRKE